MVVKYNGLLVIKHVYSSQDYEIKEIANRYVGIQGEHWPCRENYTKCGILISQETGLVDLCQLDCLLEVFDKIRTGQDKILFIADNLSFIPYDKWKKPFTFLGYDYGWYAGEHGSFSVILNDIVFSDYDRLKECRSFLNEGVLLPNLLHLQEIKSDRDELLDSGAALETESDGAESFKPIRIWGIKECLD